MARPLVEHFADLKGPRVNRTKQQVVAYWRCTW